MKKTYVVITLIVLSALAIAESKYICKVAHLGTNDIAVTCTNGADPTGKKISGNVLLISCGK